MQSFLRYTQTEINTHTHTHVKRKLYIAILLPFTAMFFKTQLIWNTSRKSLFSSNIFCNILAVYFLDVLGTLTLRAVSRESIKNISKAHSIILLTTNVSII